MYKVKVENPCSCFFKSGLYEVLEFENKTEAKKEADRIFGVMQSNFCRKHEFSLSEQFGDFTISTKLRS